MTAARSTAVLAMTLGSLAAGCGQAASSSDTSVDGTTPGSTASTSAIVVAPPPAEVLDAELVWFDGDGIDERIAEPPFGRIADAADLDAFHRRYVDGDPRLTATAERALDDGELLVGGSVSSDCFGADSVELVLIDGDVRLIPVGLPDPEPEVECVRAINSIALVAIDPGDLPDGATVQGT